MEQCNGPLDKSLKKNYDQAFMVHIVDIGLKSNKELKSRSWEKNTYILFRGPNWAKYSADIYMAKM